MATVVAVKSMEPPLPAPVDEVAEDGVGDLFELGDRRRCRREQVEQRPAGGVAFDGLDEFLEGGGGRHASIIG